MENGMKNWFASAQTRGLLACLLLALPLQVACGSNTPAKQASNAGAGGQSAQGGQTSTAAGTGGDAPRPADVCAGDGGCPPGKWIDVTPPGVSLHDGACGNYGTKTVQTDPTH